MKDHATSSLQRIASSAGVAHRRIGQTDTAIKKASRSTGVWSGKLSKLKTGLIAAFSVAAVSMFGSQVIQARSEYERFDAVLTNTFQSAEKGEASMKMLQDFAAETPFQLNKLTDSYVKLVNRGFVPSQNQMTKLGDLASSQGKSFLQLSEAILDAQTNEFERLKEFGIRGSKSGDQVSLSFKGVTKTVQNNGKAIRAAILEFGAMDGVVGAMAAISKTLGGRISNLKDQWWGFLVTVGGSASGLFASAIDKMSDALSWLTGLIPKLAPLKAAVYNLWLAFHPIIAAFVQVGQGAGVASGIINGLAMVINIAAVPVGILSEGIGFLIRNFKILGAAIATYILVQKMAIVWQKIAVIQRYMAITGTRLWTLAQRGLNAAFKANPIGFVISVIVVLVGLVTTAWKKFGWFRGIIMASWEAIKGFALAIKNLVINRFKDILSGITGIGKALVSFFKGDFEKAWEVGKKAASDLISIDSANSFINDMKGVGKQAGEAYHQGVAQVEREKAKKTALPTATGGYMGNTASEADELIPNSNTSSKTPGKTIVSGGAKRTNINVTIQKLQDDTKIYVDSTEKGLAQLGEKVQEVLLRSINSVNQMA